VPLLAKVLFDRDVEVAAQSVPATATATAELAAESVETDEPDGLGTLSQGAQRAAKTVWRLARAFREVDSLLDERPYGALASRALAKLPVVGVVGGWLDERGGIRKAARQTQRLLTAETA
jgi:hypothetical protein